MSSCWAATQVGSAVLSASLLLDTLSSTISSRLTHLLSWRAWLLSCVQDVAVPANAVWPSAGCKPRRTACITSYSAHFGSMMMPLQQHLPCHSGDNQMLPCCRL